MSWTTVLSMEHKGDKICLFKTTNVITPYMVVTKYKNQQVKEVKCISFHHASWIYDLCVNHADRPAMHGRIMDEIAEA